MDQKHASVYNSFHAVDYFTAHEVHKNKGNIYVTLTTRYTTHCLFLCAVCTDIYVPRNLAPTRLKRERKSIKHKMKQIKDTN